MLCKPLFIIHGRVKGFLKAMLQHKKVPQLQKWVWHMHNEIVATVLLNCNFIFPRMILRGTTAILQCIPITCLRGPRLLVSCNVHVLWKYMRGNTRLVEVNT